MHTAIIMAGGFALLLASGLLGHGLGQGVQGAVIGIKVFIALWFVLAAINMWIGVSRAGYPVADELPVFLTVFGVLALVAALLLWRLS